MNLRSGSAKRAHRNHWGNRKALSWEMVHVASEIQTNPKVGQAHVAEPERESRAPHSTSPILIEIDPRILRKSLKENVWLRIRQTYLPTLAGVDGHH